MPESSKSTGIDPPPSIYSDRRRVTAETSPSTRWRTVDLNMDIQFPNAKAFAPPKFQPHHPTVKIRNQTSKWLCLIHNHPTLKPTRRILKNAGDENFGDSPPVAPGTTRKCLANHPCAARNSFRSHSRFHRKMDWEKTTKIHFSCHWEIHVCRMRLANSICIFSNAVTRVTSINIHPCRMI